jgi:hypothetical protein
MDVGAANAFSLFSFSQNDPKGSFQEVLEII